MAGNSKRYLYLGLGWFFTALGFIGAFLPIMPTTVFLIIAVWAFGKSSDRLSSWLMNHPRLGPPLKNWYKYGAISPKAKILAICSILITFGFSYAFSDNIYIIVIVGLVLVSVATFILTRPDGPTVAIKSQ